MDRAFDRYPHSSNVVTPTGIAIFAHRSAISDECPDPSKRHSGLSLSEILSKIKTEVNLRLNIPLMLPVTDNTFLLGQPDHGLQRQKLYH